MLSKFCFTGEWHIKLSGIMAQDAPSAVCSRHSQALWTSLLKLEQILPHCRGAQPRPHVLATLEANAYALVSMQKAGCAVAAS